MLNLDFTRHSSFFEEECRTDVFANFEDQIIFGAGGHDEIRTQGGEDYLLGGAGDDSYIVGNGFDIISDN